MAAALNYFDKSLDQLTLEEMAYLAALPKAPANYHPIHKTRAATIRRDWVLREMQQNGFITGEEAHRARTTPLQIARQSGFDTAEAPYFAEEVRREVVSRFGEDMLYAGGLSVRTTLDPELQHSARRRCNAALRRSIVVRDGAARWQAILAMVTSMRFLPNIRRPCLRIITLPMLPR